MTVTARGLADTTTLNNGVKMPWLGLGVWRVEEGSQVEQSVAAAIANGYRSIDTAAVYGNEAGVGKAVRESGVKREELFITTKVWNADQGFDSTLRAHEASLEKLGLDYVDLYLVHWPVKGKYRETWKALVKLYEEKRVRAIGVSNHHIHHLDDIINDTGVVPAVNQVEYHPLLSQVELLSYCKSKGIQMEAWSPLMQGNNLDHPTLKELATKHGKSTAQIVLRWDLQHGVVTIPKSTKEARIKENADVFDFELSAEDMGKIDAMNENRRFGADPDNFNF
ncbi:aldo/keto reductase [Paenibacillus antri]|uniref:Aldo/keto reductase n=1 Tax=Paenibacillus antri TaxID=2582848 RepID=A0A5R9G053_9BACL|nr:aldo/keto reductase [Paenibacillus antri]TLS49692.1 aldo/keto reductase [Paenibacillus antri]